MAVNEFEEKEERPAWVTFETRPVEDAAATLAAGRSVSKDVDFALVTPAYSKDCVEYKTSTWLRNMEFNLRNKRIPPKWADIWKKQYEAFKAGQELPLNGIPLRESTAWSPAEIKNFMASGFHVVEDIAEANDEGLKRLGMGGMAHKRKAQSIIQAAKDHGPLVMKVSALEGENEQLKGTIESLQKQVDQLLRVDHNARMELATYKEPSITADDILDTPETINEQYERLLGKKPHHMMKPETILKAINDFKASEK